MSQETFNFTVLSMKVKSPEGAIFEMKMDHTPVIPITVDHTRYNELLQTLLKFANKCDRYSKMAHDRATEFGDFSTLNDAECFGANDAEGQTFGFVSRELRSLIEHFDK